MNPRLGSRADRLLILLAPLLIPTVAGPATIRVPADQPTIAAGLAAAVPGDEVVVDCRTYSENRLQVPSGVSLRGATGLAGCVTLSSGSDYYVRIQDASACLVQGFSFTNGRHGDVFVRNSYDVRIDACTFQNGKAGLHSTLDITGSEAAITNCRFVDIHASR